MEFYLPKHRRSRFGDVLEDPSTLDCYLFMADPYGVEVWVKIHFSYFSHNIQFDVIQAQSQKKRTRPTYGHLVVDDSRSKGMPESETD